MKRFWDSGIAVVTTWSLDQLIWSPRTLAMAVMTLFPAALALIFRLVSAAGIEAPVSGFGFFSVVTATVGFQFVAPMLALFYSSGIIIDEQESGTLPYLITRPITRHRLLAGKMIGSFALQALLFLPSLILTFFLAVGTAGWDELGSRFPTLVIDAGVALLGLAAYSGLFSLLGIVFRRPVLAGLIFVFGWQAAATYVPGAVSRFTIAHYLHSLIPHESFQGALSGLWGGRATATTAVIMLILITAGTHALAIFFFSRKEFPGRD
jgi:ABC-type transport system involved in multi-copper enzyme maturation permease subunit